ncbi:MAG: aminotransferase class I/II-fold pyridoxal phosphate-dependent enzyme [Crenarchaeota archaeon]|nr:aminotransferase class I/II-fold pyridoxal phosphate-dependent enzyme [Thermoproteota archaeon]
MDCLKRPWLSKLKVYKLPERPGRVVARLHMNENPFPPPKRVVEAAMRAAEAGNLYPDPERVWKLRELAAGYYGLPGPEWVLPTLGSDTALRLAFEGCALRSKVRLPFPSFQAYPPLLGAAGAELSYFSLTDEGERFSLDVEGFAGERAHMAVLDSPNNPTGALLVDEEDLERLVRSFPSVLLDEAYGEFAPKSLTPEVQSYSNLIATRTLSKAFALAGFRIGFLISNPKAVEELSKMTLPYDIPSPTVEAALEALSDPSYSKSYIEYVNKEKKKMKNVLGALGWSVYESFTNFVLVKAFKGVVAELKKRGIMVRNVPLGDEWMRVSVGRPEEMEAFYAAAEELAAKFN